MNDDHDKGGCMPIVVCFFVELIVFTDESSSSSSSLRILRFLMTGKVVALCDDRSSGFMLDQLQEMSTYAMHDEVYYLPSTILSIIGLAVFIFLDNIIIFII